MCSLNDDESRDDFILTQKPSFSENTTCRSCNNRGVVVLQKKDVYCRDCFLATETHKFRATLGKSKMMKPQDKVLLAFSGSQSSFSLLHLLNSGVAEDQHKKLLFSVLILYIDEGVLFDVSVEKRQEVVEEIKRKVDIYNFPFFITTLSEVFCESPTLDYSLIVNKKNDSELVKLFENIKSMSSKEDLLYILKQKVLLNAAKELNCNKIFTSEVGTDLAIKLLTSFSLGRGDQASFETGFCDSRHSHCKILRPLRDFTKKEIVFYNSFHQLDALYTPSLTTKSPSNISIKKLTEKFVTDLHEKFPSTVYTIFRTGEKLSINMKDAEQTEEKCLLCKDIIRTSGTKTGYSAVEAANFSENVSRKVKNNCDLKGNESCCGSCHGKVETSGIINGTELKKFLCYGCSLIIKDMKDIECLPRDLLQLAIQKRDFEVMKEHISEFLIEESSEVEV